MVVGLVVLSSGHEAAEPEPEPQAKQFSPMTTIWVAVVTAGCYGGMLYCAGTVEGTSALWTVTVARALATVGALGLCLAQGAVRPNRAGLPFAAGAGVCDLAAFSFFVAGAQHDPAIAAVAVSQYGAVAVLFAVLFLHERLTRPQIVAVGVLAAGAAVVAGTG
jgi:drug/metabolite transporter (DMT)-like permease